MGRSAGLAPFKILSYQNRDAVEAGGLMSYGADLAESYRRVATYVSEPYHRRSAGAEDTLSAAGAREAGTQRESAERNQGQIFTFDIRKS